MRRQCGNTQIRQRWLGHRNQHDIQSRRGQPGAHQDAGDGNHNQRKELLNGCVGKCFGRYPGQ